MILFAVRDVKVGSFGRAFSMDCEISAIRDLSTAIGAGQSLLSQFPSDFELFELGYYDDVTGILHPLACPKFIISCQSIVTSMATAKSKLSKIPTVDKITDIAAPKA